MEFGLVERAAELGTTMTPKHGKQSVTRTTSPSAGATETTMKKKLKSNSPLDAATCSPSSDTPETDEMGSMRRTVTEWRNLCEKLERERNEWKANNDNQVALKRIIAARPDLKDRAPMVEKLMAERNRAQGWSTLQHEKIKRLEKAGSEIIEAARRSLPRPHPTIERNAKLFIPENETSPSVDAKGTQP